MSTKTLKQRIALVAVSALAAGFLSIASAPVANASTTTALDGALDATTGSIGIVGAITPTLSAMAGGATTRTAVLLSSGSLRLSTSGTATIKVSAGARVDAVNTGSATTGTGTVNSTQTCAEGVVAADFTVIKPVGAAGSTFTVTTYDENTCALAATIVDVITVTIAASSVAGVPSPSESAVRWDSDSAGSNPTAAQDSTNSSTTTGNQLYLRMNIADAYGQDISEATGSLVVTVSSGAYLGTIGTTAGSAALAAVTTRVSTEDPSALWVRVGEATAGAGWKGTVTVSYNGVLIATKSGTITGAASKLTATAYKIAKTGTSNPDPAFLWTVTDTAGNGVGVAGSSIVMDTSSNSAVVSDAVGTTTSAEGNTYGDWVGQGTIACTDTAGTSSVVVKHTLSNGTVIKSAPFTATCGGDAATYTASFDKASYVQGEVAKLTIVFRDSKGNLANSHTAVDTITSNASNMSISAPMMAQVGSFTTATKPSLAGALEVNFTVGTSSGLTAGSYNAVVNIPNLNTLGKAQSVAYKVTTGTTSVTNEDVLKSIVSLIASINKQIQALQKLILRR